MQTEGKLTNWLKGRSNENKQAPCPSLMNTLWPEYTLFVKFYFDFDESNLNWYHYMAEFMSCKIATDIYF